MFSYLPWRNPPTLLALAPQAASECIPHGALEKDLFTSVNITLNCEFNQSVIKDYENRLIGLMAADGVYKLTNKNEGHKVLKLFSKEKYESMFEIFWGRACRWSRIYKTISELKNL